MRLPIVSKPYSKCWPGTGVKFGPIPLAGGHLVAVVVAVRPVGTVSQRGLGAAVDVVVQIGVARDGAAGHGVLDGPQPVAEVPA